MSATSTAVVSGALLVGKAVYDTYSERQQQEYIKQQNLTNAKIAQQGIDLLHYEEAQNATKLRMDARTEIFAGANSLAAKGNIGSSAESSILNAYSNLAGDLAAMSFNYETKVVDLRNQKAAYETNARIAEQNKKNALIAGIFNIGSATVQGYVNYSMAGGKYGFNSPYWDIAEYTNPETGEIEKTWHGGIFSDLFSSKGIQNNDWGKAWMAGTAKDSSGNVIPFGKVRDYTGVSVITK